MQPALDGLRAGLTVEGVHYGPIEATLDREQGANVWLTVGIREGKNREVRKVLETLGLKVNRLIRVAFGPFELGELDEGAVEEVKTEELRTALGPEIVAQAEADFDAPLIEHDDRPISLRHPETRAQRASKGDGRSSFEARQGRAPQDDGERPVHAARKKQPRRDRTGGPRPKYPRPRE